jgi:hypothetical protein
MPLAQLASVSLCISRNVWTAAWRTGQSWRPKGPQMALSTFSIHQHSPFSLWSTGKRLHNYGKSQFFMGKSTISTGPCSIAFCKFTRGYLLGSLILTHFWHITGVDEPELWGFETSLPHLLEIMVTSPLFGCEHKWHFVWESQPRPVSLGIHRHLRWKTNIWGLRPQVWCVKMAVPQ